MLIVQKYGGTSVGDLKRIENVANKIANPRNRQDLVVGAIA